MPGKCSVCQHPEVTNIDLALASRATLRDVAATFSLGRGAVDRHKNNCLSSKLSRAKAEQKEGRDAASLLDQMKRLQDETLQQLDIASSGKAKPADVARIIREARENIRIVGQLTAQFPRDPAMVTNIDNRKQIIALQNLSEEDLQRLIASLERKTEALPS
jgi:hypothetical protein